MQAYTLIEITQKALLLTLLVSAPLAVAAAVTGLVVAVLQAATQIQDQSIGQSIKLIVLMVLLLLLGNWMGSTIKIFAKDLFHNFAVLVRPEGVRANPPESRPDLTKQGNQ